MKIETKREKVVAIFVNDDGHYYLECVESYELFTDDNVKGWGVSKTIDETEDWENFRLTQKELRNPTTDSEDILAVITWMDSHDKSKG